MEHQSPPSDPPSNLGPIAVVAIGGNALIEDSEHRSVQDQYRTAGRTARHLTAMVATGYRLVITHGNGPQVGFILLRSEIARGQLHTVPLESCVADTQGAIGYQIAQTLGNALRTARLPERPIAAVLSQVVVDENDPAFQRPTKPIGPFYTADEAKLYASQYDWTVREDAGRGWRRVVPCPHPIEIVEESVISAMLERGVITIAVGGGGVPVVRAADGSLHGVPAVIDKDFASCLLAKRLGAELFLISTAVEKVCLNFGQPDEVPLDEMSIADARRYIAEGHFAEGSMKPKIEAAVDYLESGGGRAIITVTDRIEDALAGRTGTHIVP